MDPIDELKSRPTLEQIITRYEQMQQRVFDALSTELGPFTWEPRHEGTASLCGQGFPSDTSGRRTSLPLWAFEGSIPDAQWPRAVQIVADITAEYGFDPPKILADRPGQHAIAGAGEYGANYRFSGQINTSWQIATGCHLPAAAHPNP